MSEAAHRPPAKTAEVAPAAITTPLVVDLDGSLVRTDTTLEAMLALARRPLALLRTLPSLRHGRASFKQRLAAASDLDVAGLPYHLPLLAYLREQRAAGRRLVLATGADRKPAEAVARYLGIFDHVLASDGRSNLTGTAKLAAIRICLAGASFSYVGNSATDLGVWCGAAGAVCVNLRPSVARAAAQMTRIERSFAPETAWPILLLRAMRPWQWVANLLIFAPLLAAGSAIGGPSRWLAASVTFVAFCCAASGVPIGLDLTNLAADRRHPRRRGQPFASGVLPLHIGVMAAPVLILLSIVLSFAVGVLLLALCYMTVSFAYLFWLKPRPLVGVVTLTALYGACLLAGGVATGYPMSSRWLTFSGILLLGCAVVQRIAERKVPADNA